MKKSEDLPQVSVIVPFMNNHEEVLQIKQELDHQTFPARNIELIFVDNGSERMFTFPEDFANRVKLLREDHHKKSPYSARNRGTEAASGEIIVFLDANSRPERNWLEKGVNHLMTSYANIVAGRVEFDLSEHPTVANIVDAITSINMKKAVEERGVAYTANLFVRKEVIEKTGLFEEGTRSGGDVRWCMKANELGYRIDYCSDAVVYKKPRTFRELMKKKMRTGRGYFYTWQMETEKQIWFYNFFRSLKPPSKEKIENLNPDRSHSLKKGNFLSIGLTVYIIGIAEQLSFMGEYLTYNLGSQRNIDRGENQNRKSADT